LPEAPSEGTPTFTIIVPTCDRPDLLEHALSSVRGQTCADWRLIVVDDGTQGLDLGPLVQPFDDVRLFKTTGRIGAASARNVGLEHVDTDWIVFLDDDDEFLPDFLENLKGRVAGKSTEPVLAITDLIVVDYNSDREVVRERVKTFVSAPTPPGHDIHQAIRTGMSGLAINRCALGRAGPMDPSYKTMDDSEWIFRLVEAGAEIVFVSPASVRVHNHARGDRLSDARLFDLRIEECERAKARFQTLGGRFPGLGDLLDAIIRGLKAQIEPAA